MNIILCGLPNSGKSTCGPIVAKLLEYSFVDADRLMEKNYHERTGQSKSAREIFNAEGNKIFRDLETEVLEQLQTEKQVVIALGGGALMTSGNPQLIKSLGKLIYLECDAKVILERFFIKGVPSYLDKDDVEGSFLEYAKQRCPIYEKTADIIVKTENMSPQQIAEEIYEIIRRK